MFLPISQQGILVWTIEPYTIGKGALKHRSPKITFIFPRNTIGYFWPSLCLRKRIFHWQNLCLHVVCSLLSALQHLAGATQLRPAESPMDSETEQCTWGWKPGAWAAQGQSYFLTPHICLFGWAFRHAKHRGKYSQHIAVWHWGLEPGLPGSPSSVLQLPYSQWLDTTQRYYFPRKHLETCLSWKYNGIVTFG